MLPTAESLASPSAHAAIRFGATAAGRDGGRLPRRNILSCRVEYVLTTNRSSLRTEDYAVSNFAVCR
jgi:hypothetical protein